MNEFIVLIKYWVQVFIVSTDKSVLTLTVAFLKVIFFSDHCEDFGLSSLTVMCLPVFFISLVGH